jgi:hypothetical protein
MMFHIHCKTLHDIGGKSASLHMDSCIIKSFLYTKEIADFMQTPVPNPSMAGEWLFLCTNAAAQAQVFSLCWTEFYIFSCFSSQLVLHEMHPVETE